MSKQWKFTHAQKTLEALLDEATVDAYGDEEQFTGVVITLDENLPFPFTAQIVGETVEVIGIDENASSLSRGIVARVRRDNKEFRVGLAELSVPHKIEINKYWEMYQYWLGGF
ncbi:MAG: hypothetical protein HY741_08405 [Chloroflexi bacterium]|nr:hypothetical protein [Chloroflexota bacterium]